MREALDPHHDGAMTWGWDGNTLWIRSSGGKTWTPVSKVSVTPARIAMLYNLIQPRKAPRDDE